MHGQKNIKLENLYFISVNTNNYRIISHNGHYFYLKNKVNQPKFNKMLFLINNKALLKNYTHKNRHTNYETLRR